MKFGFICKCNAMSGGRIDLTPFGQNMKTRTNKLESGEIFLQKLIGIFFRENGMKPPKVT